MKPTSINLAVQNSLLIIRDPTKWDPPKIWDPTAVWSTPSCVAVSCLSDCDGDTAVTIGAAEEVEHINSPLFDGQLETPSRTVVVETVLGEKVLEQNVSSANTRLRVWTNGRLDPDKVIIGLD